MSESVVNVTSGSTIFGNSSDDTHTFTGDITASEGNLSIEHASSPKLIVKDTNNNRKLEIEQGNIFSIIRFDDHTTQDLKFISNNDGNHLVLDAGNGFTGLGTDTPGEKLTVIGNISASGDVIASGQISSSGTGENYLSGDLNMVAANVVLENNQNISF